MTNQKPQTQPETEVSQIRFNPSLLKVPAYVGGKSIEQVKADLALDEVIKLASNESPIGPSPLAMEAAERALQEANRYPGVYDRILRQKLATCLDSSFSEENIVIGNGGTNILHLVAQAFLFDGGNTVMAQATFVMYRISALTFGATPRIVANLPDYRHDLAAMTANIDHNTRIAYLCTPNNPTGDIITQAEADNFMARVPEHVVVIFDEAYYDFVADPTYADSLAYIKEGRNVLTMRTFSKSAGLANLRVGYIVGRPELTNYIRRALLPFHTSTVALAAAAASIDDEAYRTRLQQLTRNEKSYLYSALQELGLTYLKSEANFITLVDPPGGAEALAQALLQQGVIVRAMTGFGMPNGLRATIGTHKENKKFVSALKTILASW